MIRMDFDIPISTLTLLELYWNDKVWEEGMPEFYELSVERKRFIMDSYCFALFVNSQRAKELQLEMLARMN